MQQQDSEQLRSEIIDSHCVWCCLKVFGGLEATSEGEDLHWDVLHKILSAYRKSVVL